MTCFIATLKIKPGHEAEFERLQAELSKLTHASEPDTFVYDIIRSRTKPGYVRRLCAFQGRGGVPAAPGHGVPRTPGAADHRHRRGRHGPAVLRLDRLSPLSPAAGCLR